MVILGEKPWVRCLPESPTYGKFIVEPLEKGHGATLGNSLRRVLLSSLPGAAVTAIKIEGIAHEFSTIPQVKEDILEIILNIKRLVLKFHGEGSKTLTLQVKGKKEIKASDIKHDAEIEIVNPELHLASLEGGKLNMELTVEKGKGYVPSERNKKPGQSLGTIPVDSIFTPVLKANVGTEEIRVGREINYDRLILEVWTNGSITPEEAVKESAKILAKHVDLFVHLGSKGEELGIKIPKMVEEKESVLDLSIEDLELSARSSNCLKKAGIKTLRELIERTEQELLRVENFGAKSAKEVKEKLSEYQLTLKGEKVEPPKEEVKEKPKKARGTKP